MPIKKVSRPLKSGCSCDSGCSCGGKCTTCWIIVFVLIVALAVGYFVYNEYTKKSAAAPFMVTQENGVPTISPGGGLVPDGPPPSAINPTTPPPKN